nr:hypothetical protein [Tanacetum cinerariifolium]
MTRSSTKELLTPFKELEREFQSSMKLFKTLSLDESRSPVDIFSDLEENFEEEVSKTMAETMKQYMSKTRADYGSGITRPKIDDKDHFELKGQFLKEPRDNTFSGSDHEDANEHIKKVLEILDLFHAPNITQDHIMLRVFLMSQTEAASRSIPTKTVADAKVAIQKMAEYSQKWHNGTSRTRSTKTSDGLAAIQAQLNNLGREIKKVNEKVYVDQVGCEQCKGPHYTKDCPLKEEDKTLEEAYYTQFAKRHEENSNLTKEIRAFTDAAIRNQRALIKSLEIQIGQMSKVLLKRGFGSLPSSTETNSRDHVKSISTTDEADMTPIRRASVSIMPLSTYLNLGLGELAHTKLTVELADRTVKYPKGIAENVLVGFHKFVFPVDFIILDMPKDVKVPLIFGRPFLSTSHTKIDLFKRKITLRAEDDKIIFKSMKPGSSLIKRVYMLGLRERMELDLEARLMGEILVLNRSLDPLYGDYFELNDLKVPLELRRDQVDDLMPTIEEGEVIDKPMIDIIKTRNNESFDEYPSFCDFDRKIHIDCAYNLRFSYMIVENMDGYRDQDMGEIIFGEPFCKASCVEVRRFNGLITIHNGNDYVTYQMARSHPRFKHLSSAQCNKIKPLLKVSLHDKLNRISHPYQKLKSFYKGVLNLGPEYVRDAKMEEWLTRGHISVHKVVKIARR